MPGDPGTLRMLRNGGLENLLEDSEGYAGILVDSEE
jgi:hypothetical protein